MNQKKKSFSPGLAKFPSNMTGREEALVERYDHI